MESTTRKRLLSEEMQPDQLQAPVNYSILLNTIKTVTSAQKSGILAVQSTLKFSFQLLQKYPSVKTFVYSTCALSAVPVGIFSMFLVASFCVSVCTALAGLFVVQGTVFLIGLSILIPVEIAIVCLAGGISVLFRNNEYLRERSQQLESVYTSTLTQQDKKDEMTLILE